MMKIYLLLIMVIYCVKTEAAKRPYLLSYRRIIVEGSPTTGSVNLKGVARTGKLKWIVVTQPDNRTIYNVTFSNTGRLQMYGICNLPQCRIETQFKIILKDDAGSRSYILKVDFGEKRLKSQLVLKPEERTKRRGLSLLYIYLIIEGACIAVMLVICLLVMNCCTFHTAIYDRPIKGWNRVKAAVTKPQHEMNPYAKQRKLSLLVREAVRSGAADGQPYYGERKRGVWVPENEQDERRESTQPIRETAEPRIRENKEDTTPVNQAAERRESKPRKASIATVGRRLSQDMSLFKQVPWNDISQPQTTTILPPPEE